jgi:hypothetical protein
MAMDSAYFSLLGVSYNEAFNIGNGLYSNKLCSVVERLKALPNR